MYNLLMTAAANAWNNPTYVMPTARFLEHTVPAVASKFEVLSPEIIQELKNLPTLFAYESFIGEPARVGRIVDIRRHQTGLHFTFSLDPLVPPIAADRLEQLAFDLDIDATGYEFMRTHWAIKDVDLGGVLIRAGIVASAYLQPQPPPPKVFIAYSWDSPEHQQWVAGLAAALRQRGIDAILDQWHVRPGQDLAAFMNSAIRESDRVLVICTEAYVQKANDRTGGVGYEYVVATGELMANLGTSKFIPVIRQTSTPYVLPAELRSRLYFNLSDSHSQAGDFDALAKELHGIRVSIPPIGMNPYR